MDHAAPADPRLLLAEAAALALAAGEVGDPFALLGPHRTEGGTVVRAFVPGALGVELIAGPGDAVIATLQPVQVEGLFAGFIASEAAYRLRIRWPAEHGGNRVQETADPYAFGLLLGELDLHLLAEGRHLDLGCCLGAQPLRIEGVQGVRFAVWAPNARRVSVVGAFNSWQGNRHPMRRRLEAGVWELFVPDLLAGECYQYEVLGPAGLLPRKADPLALQAVAAPGQASVVPDATPFVWHDAEWLHARAARQAANAPMSTYEVHPASWQREGEQAPDWAWLAARLIPYVVGQGFTHIELMPVMAHPFGGSWGYQPLSLFAPQASYGEPRAFAAFIDACHAAGIGVLLDWVPAHFPDDAHGLAQFDGTHLYEHADPREGVHEDWNTLIYNFGRREVAGFLIASALHWLERYHVDGLRVDAVASMLYRDYSRKPGEWLPNAEGGRENLEAVAFLKALNQAVAERCPGALVIAEESTSWPGVTRAVADGGLGFTGKWNMGWMNDTLAYVHLDPLYRKAAHERITFGLMYAFSERFVLPISHDEVVHGKRSLIDKIPGDPWQQFATLRTLYGLMWSHPGQKLLFMGCEFAQRREWNHDRALDWHLLDAGAAEGDRHRGVQLAVRDLNHLYRTLPALHERDSSADGFQWLLVDAAAESLYAYCRFGEAEAAPVVVVLNFTPVPRPRLTLGVPRAGRWREVFNSDASAYGGSGVGNLGHVRAQGRGHREHPASLTLTVPPLSAVWMVWEPD